MTAEQVSVAELIGTGITLSADEAVAIARALVRERSSFPALVPTTHEPPLPENVYLGPDGSVACPTCDTPPEVSDLALFLRRLLPIGAAGVPGGLHYMIARALREVDAPAFDSVGDFSSALARFEHGERGELLRRLFESVQAMAVSRPRPFAERRRANPATFGDLRRALQEADAQLFEQKLALETLKPARPARAWNKLSIAACLTTAVAGLAAGNAMHGQLATATPTPAPPAQSLTMPAATAENRPRDIVLDAPARPARAVTQRPGSKHSAGAPARKSTVKSASPPRSEDRGLFKRLRLEWLRKAFSRRT